MRGPGGLPIVPGVAAATPGLPVLLREAARRAAWAGLLLVVPALPALAATWGRVQLSDAGQQSEVVFNFARLPGYSAVHQGNVTTVTFEGAMIAGGVAGSAHNVRSVQVGGGVVTVTVTPGARVRVRQAGPRLVLDVTDPPGRPGQRTAPIPPAVASASLPGAGREPAGASAGPAAQAEAGEQTLRAGPSAVTAAGTAPTGGPAGPAAVAQAALPAVPVAPIVPAQPAPASAGQGTAGALPAGTPSAGTRAEAPAPAATDPLAIAAIPAPLPPGAPGSAIVLPFGTGVGAAAFRQGDAALVVFDVRRPIDLSGVTGDPAFAAAQIALLPSATTLSLPLPAGGALRLARRADGWLVAAVPAVSPVPIVPVVVGDALSLPANAPGQVVAVPDAQTGGTLLVGTQRAGGEAVVSQRQVPEFVLERTWQGVVVAPVSDRIELRAVPEGFRLGASGGPLELAPTPDGARVLADAASLTRRFDFPDLPIEALRRRLEREVATAAQAPALARLAPREAAAQTMIALGLGAEAQSLLQLAVDEAPQQASDSDVVGLAAIAALLAGRVGEADGLLAPSLSGTDEVALWRAVLAATGHEEQPDAAAVFAAELPLVLTYPEVLRQRLLPLAAETMLRGGQVPAARALLARLPKEPVLAFARALALQQAGDTDGALAAYAVLAQDHDRLLHARAEAATTELQLSAGRIDAATAARTMSDQLAAWRGGAREQRMRLRLAEVQVQAHAWRGALDTLRDTEALFPEARADLRGRVAAVFDGVLKASGAGTSPLDIVTLVDENADLLPGGEAGDRLSVLLADKLVALDLPNRAEPVLAKLAAAVAPGPGRATLGQHLAEMRLESANPTGAVAALAATDSPGLPSALVAARTFVLARAEARLGDVNGATALLAGLGTPAADDLRAKVLAAAHDWHGAEAVLAGLAAAIPAAGPLDDGQQDLLVRLAGAAAQAGDAAQLGRLRGQSARVGGPRGEMFRLLVAAPVQGLADLPRAAGETVLARAIPAGLQAMNPR